MAQGPNEKRYWDLVRDVEANKWRPGGGLTAQAHCLSAAEENAEDSAEEWGRLGIERDSDEWYGFILSAYEDLRATGYCEEE